MDRMDPMDRTNKGKLDVESVLSPEELSACEQHMQRVWGENVNGACDPASRDLNQAPSAKKDQEGEADGGVQGMESAHAWVSAACRSAQPSPAFTRKTMALILADSLNQADPAAPFQTFSSPSQAGSSNPFARVWMPVAAAACLFLGVMSWMKWSGPEADPTVATQDQKGFQIAAAKNQKAQASLVDADGKQVKSLAPGKRYRVEGGPSLVLQKGKDTMVRMMEGAVIETPKEMDAPQLRLVGGSLYAHQPGKDVLEVECDTFDTRVQGTSLVHQDPAQSVEVSQGVRKGTLPALNANPMARGLVVVFNGSAKIRIHFEDRQVTVKAGEMYVSGMDPEPTEEFLRLAKTRTKILKASKDPQDYRKNRDRYATVVKGYREDLKKIEAKLAVAGGEKEKEKLLGTRKRFQGYLAEHEARLKEMPSIEANESPVEHASWLERATQEVNNSESSFQDPEEWL